MSKKCPNQFRRRPKIWKPVICPKKPARLSRKIQIYNHKSGIVVLHSIENGYCLTNGIKSFVQENDPSLGEALARHLADFNVSTVCLTDEASFFRWDRFQTRFKERFTVSAVNMKIEAAQPAKRVACVGWPYTLRKVAVEEIPHDR